MIRSHDSKQCGQCKWFEKIYSSANCRNQYVSFLWVDEDEEACYGEHYEPSAEQTLWEIANYDIEVKGGE